MHKLKALIFCCGALLPMLVSAQAEQAGTVGLASGNASAVAPGGAARVLVKGSPVYSGDVVETRESSYLLLNFTDQGSVLLRPSTRFVVEQYHVQPPSAPVAATPQPPSETFRPAPAPLTVAGGAPESSLFRLLKGSLRAVSGLIGRRDYSHYKLFSPVATMGIRGTDYVAAVCETVCAADPVVQAAVPPGTNLDGAVVTGVFDGQVEVVSMTGATTVLGPGQYVLTLADGTQILLSGAPAFLSAASMAVPMVGAAAAGGTAAGGATAAQSAAVGGLTTGIVVGTSAAVVLGVVISTIGDDGRGATPTTTSTRP